MNGFIRANKGKNELRQKIWLKKDCAHLMPSNRSRSNFWVTIWRGIIWNDKRRLIQITDLRPISIWFAMFSWWFVPFCIWTIMLRSVITCRLFIFIWSRIRAAVFIFIYCILIIVWFSIFMVLKNFMVIWFIFWIFLFQCFFIFSFFVVKSTYIKLKKSKLIISQFSIHVILLRKYKQI